MAQQLKQGTTSMLAIDKHGSVLRDKGSEATKEFSYTPYGYDRSCQIFRPVLGFNAELRTELGDYFLGNGHRPFIPSLMRFGSPDSYSPFGAGGINTYCYCLNDPVNRTDPSGHTSIYRHARSLVKGGLNLLGREPRSSSIPASSAGVSLLRIQNIEDTYQITPGPTPTSPRRINIFDDDPANSRHNSFSSTSEFNDLLPYYEEAALGVLPRYDRAMALLNQTERSNDSSNDTDRIRESAALTERYETQLPDGRRGGIIIRRIGDRVRRDQ
ncbi:RHS repeat-associated core domain-containing protein [Pseudomonas soli]|uniref:RHS repeat-associated core domain-containing protein n=1 Tax=Pseudomonas soli TaxID=1306993 RepID=UPI0038055A1C